MNINLISESYILFFKESLSPVLNNSSKKILIVAGLALAVLALSYLIIHHFWFKDSKLEVIEQTMDEKPMDNALTPDMDDASTTDKATDPKSLTRDKIKVFLLPLRLTMMILIQLSSLKE